MKVLLPVTVFALTISFVSEARSQVDTSTAQMKLLSKRAAEADAYRKLAEAIKGLQITSDTYVKDFVAESDTIKAEMDEFIRGVRLGDPSWYDDGSCEVPAEVTVARLIQTIKEIHTRHYKGNKISGRDIEQIQSRTKKKVIRAVGMGAPREDLPPDLPTGVEEQLGAPPVETAATIPDIWRQIGARARLMAIRAAEIDAKRKLLERIKGLRMTSDTLVRDFVAESDTITAQAMGKVIGASVVRTYLHDDEPIAEVTVEVPVEWVISVIKELHTRSIQGGHVKGTDISNIARSIKTKTFRATGMGVPPRRYIDAYNAKVDQPDDQLPAWATTKIEAKGQGVPSADKNGSPQGRLMAARAAELDAKRRLAERVYGLTLQSSTSVKDFVAQHDEIRSHMDAVLIGAVVEHTTFDGEVAEVTVSIPGIRVWEIVHQRIRIVRR